MGGPGEYSVAEQLNSAQARKLLSYCLREGSVRLTKHAREKPALTGHKVVDILNVTSRGRVYEAGEWNDGFQQWRYRVHTERFCVAVAFEENASSVVITFWEKKGV